MSSTHATTSDASAPKVDPETVTLSGYAVEERTITADEVVEWAGRPGAEAALSGTAAVLSPVGTLVHGGETVTVGDGGIGEHTMRLRQALTDIHTGAAPDTHGWCTTPG